MKFEFSRQIFEKYSNIKFHENPSNGAEFHAEGKTNMKKLIGVFCYFAHLPINTNCRRCLPQGVFLQLLWEWPTLGRNMSLF